MMNEHLTIISQTDSERIAHVWADSQWWAIQAARAANRPLLIRGEPGIGKTQLAYAAAKFLKRPILAFTVDSKTEARDLMWSFDAVGRLAEAQVASHQFKDDLNGLKNAIDVQNFVKPGPLWWAIHWDSAEAHAKRIGMSPALTPEGWARTDGPLILIDEIDKADSDVPNGLLEVFGMRQFTPHGWQTAITSKPGSGAPLVIITTNEERMLPDAFLRRCVVLAMKMPDCLSPEGEPLREEAAKPFLNYLVQRGFAHFDRSIPEEQLKDAAKLLMEDRQQAILQNQHPLPGQAEYLDFLRALNVLAKEKLAENPKANPKTVYQEISASIQSFMFEKSIGLPQS